jgi:anion-transporting  ArsA/GET3 family ATPase
VSPIADAVQNSDVLVCVGSGGVGKTTIAATLGLRAAVEGKTSLVCTIDPARRLANSLGLERLGNTESRIAPELLTQTGQAAKGELFAMMLDMKRTWDELIERNAAPDKREKILNNRFYQALSTALAGSQEYIAIEKLWELRTQRNYPLVVLDTPPTAHALDFLDAPNRILDFLDNEAAKWLLTPALAAGKVGLKLFNLGSSYVAKTISRFTGTETLQELASFMLALSGLNEAFRERAHQTRALLAADTTAFVLVTGPMAERLDEAIYFHTVLQQHHLNVAAIVVNRVHPLVSEQAWEEASHLPAELRARVVKTLDEAEHDAQADRASIERLKQACAPTPLVLVPRFERDVHDISSLWHTSEHLFTP